MALPRLVVELDATQRDFLQKAALAGQTVRVPLPSPPSDDLHELWVRTKGFPEPLVLLATRVGPLAPTGYPLSLSVAPPPAPDPRVGRELAGGKLVIEARIGEGGAGTVYRARHTALHLHVAVKVLHESYNADADFIRRFHAEALSASTLDHPNLTRVLDFGEEADGLLYLAMEYLEGKSLRDVLLNEERLGAPRALQLVTQVCSGLTHAHARNIIHRDIKPENLVLVRRLDDDGHDVELVKVCDFGIAHRPSSNARSTEPAGTPDYMAPEQFFGEQPDMQSDVYSCGVLLYELLTGEVPFTGSVAEIMTQQHAMEIDAPSVRVPGVDPRIDRIVFKALARDKAKRYASVRDLRAELRALSGSGASFSVPPPRASQPDWFESGSEYLYNSMLPAMQPSMAAPATTRSKAPSLRPLSLPPDSSVDVPVAVAPILARLDATKAPKAFAAIVPSLELSIRAVLEAGDPTSVWLVRRALDEIALEPAGFGGATRAAFLSPLLGLFYDAKLLAAVAEKSLDSMEDRAGRASKVVVRAGKAGVYALYAARLKHRELDARQRFVANVLEIGAPALGILCAGLEKLESRLAHAGAEEIVEDLLLALPATVDSAAAAVVVRYARSDATSIALAATGALPNVAGRGARPFLLKVLGHKDARVVVGAIAGLRAINTVDVEVVDRLKPLLLGPIPAEHAVRLAILEALAQPTADAVASARALCAAVVASVVGRADGVDDLIVVAASSLISIGGDRAVVLDRCRKSATWLRTRLEALLQRSSTRP